MPPSEFVDNGIPFPFRRVEGEGLYEITVGPVHAGIIEPGHFRFSVEGKTIVNLESRLYFVHKGIEKLFETLPGASAFGLVEGWRGPIWHWIVAGENGLLERVKVKDPSFANWPALNYAILKNIVPDFPLVNKSFNLSYAGNDL